LTLLNILHLANTRTTSQARRAAYRLAKGGAVERIDAATLETLCAAFNLRPGDLLERMADNRAARH